MKGMGRGRFTTVAAALAILALAATLPLPCACPPRPAATGEHACCEPPVGYQAADPGCCATLAATPEGTAVLVPFPQADSLAALVVVVPPLTPPSPALAGRFSSPAPVFSPPVTVRRL
jgi:hypothetical protein